MYIEDGSLYMLINYYLEGPKNKGTVFCKVKRVCIHILTLHLTIIILNLIHFNLRFIYSHTSFIASS
jgi:hypothetical protein